MSAKEHSTATVYRFRDACVRVLYVGRATELRAPVGSYGCDLRDRRQLRRMVPAVTRIEAIACDSVHKAAWLERNLLEESLPRWNRRAGGAEVPAYLRCGVSAADREELAEAVAAARRELERVRDRASAALAFELAGRVQEELRALGWVTAPQQVTTLEPVDLAVRGWADGWLVSFAVRAGRVRSWSQRRCARPPQEPPAAWAGFARRNAELAATLARHAA